MGLEPEKRQKLSQLILSYEEIDFTQLNLEKFSKEELSYVFRLGDFTLKSSKGLTHLALRGPIMIYLNQR